MGAASSFVNLLGRQVCVTASAVPSAQRTLVSAYDLSTLSALETGTEFGST